jgi:hypothetical protein
MIKLIDLLKENKRPEKVPKPYEVRQQAKILAQHKEFLKNDGPWLKGRRKEDAQYAVNKLEKFMDKWGHLATEFHGANKHTPPGTKINWDKQDRPNTLSDEEKAKRKKAKTDQFIYDRRQAQKDVNNILNKYNNGVYNDDDDDDYNIDNYDQF